MACTTGGIFNFTQIDETMQCELLNRFWPQAQIPQDSLIQEDYSAFLHHINGGLQDLRSHSTEFAVHSLDDLFRIVEELRSNPNSTREALKDALKSIFSSYVPEENISRSIELTIRLWIGVNVDSKHLSVGKRNPGDSRIDWKRNVPFNDMISSQFRGQTLRQGNTNFQLDHSFTAASLKSICRIRLRWTSNLKDHLKLEGSRGKRVLSIYQHKICLINHHKDLSNEIIGKDVLDEAIRTLELLFPLGDPDTEALLKTQGISLYPTSHLVSQPPDLTDFKYWRSSLSQLLNLLNGPPETVTQALTDRRNLSQWVTLWVAIFGVFLITILFGIVATVYAAKSYNISVKSYELSLAVACQQKTTPLPGFCD